MTWFGLADTLLAARLGLPRVVGLDRVASTMDVAHSLAVQGVAAGTLVLAQEQTAGRGRSGRPWSSRPGDGLLLTLIERPQEADGLDVLSLRVGLHLAPVLERWSADRIRLKWPNDLYVGRRKLAGVLIEARWRGAKPDWVAIGLGINLVSPADVPDATALDGTTADALIGEVIPALRAAAFARGPLTSDELAEFARRDLAVGQRVSLPASGLVRGISPAGELLLETPDGVAPFRAGSLVFANT